MQDAGSLTKINEAINILRKRGEAITQKNVSIQSCLFVYIVKKYWHQRNLDTNEWQKSLLLKARKIRADQYKVNVVIKKLVEENEMLKKQNKMLMESAYEKVTEYFNEREKRNLCDWIAGIKFNGHT